MISEEQIDKYFYYAKEGMAILILLPVFIMAAPFALFGKISVKVFGFEDFDADNSGGDEA